MPRRVVTTRVIAKYLRQYACPDAQLQEHPGERWSCVLVVPAHCEQPTLLDGYRAGLVEHATRGGHPLCIIVVNTSTAHSQQVHEANRRLVEGLRARLQNPRRLGACAGTWIGQYGPADVMIVDRTTAELRLPSGQGVGLARKIGCDIAVGLYAAGALTSPWVHTTDADATLPPEYFDMVANAGTDNTRVAGIAGDSRTTAACVYPYWHTPTGDPLQDRAIGLYEIYLRHYSLGLWAARSAWAFATIGSTICVNANAYAAVRGFPRRLAGEDFHLLAKLAKVGPIAVLRGPAIQLSGRPSARTPFGTGPGARVLASKLADGGTLMLPSAQAFAALARFHQFLEEVEMEPRALEAGYQRLCEGPGGEHLEPALKRVGAWKALARASETCGAQAVFRTRVATWFDALKTLRLMHGLRDAGLPDVPWEQALAGLVEWKLGVFTNCSGLGTDVERWRRWLARVEGCTVQAR